MAVDVTSVPLPLRSGSPALFRRAIALSLTRWRQDAGLTQKDASGALQRTIQHVSNLESGNRSASAGDLELLLRLYGKADRITFMRQVLAAGKRARNWWTQFSGAVPEWFDLFLGLEGGAVELSSFDTVVVPGLLQRHEYARAVIRGNTDLTDEQIEQRVELRLGRQQVLSREDDPPSFWTVIDESALYRVRGDAGVMNRQLKNLLEMSERPRIDIQILPLDAGSTPAQDTGSFKIMKFPVAMENDPGVVYIELLTGGKYLEKPEEIAAYDRALSRLRALAADQKTSRAIIKKALKEVT
jgi:transcriptional regulator with XRE-family HTH domain